MERFRCGSVPGLLEELQGDLLGEQTRSDSGAHKVLIGQVSDDLFIHNFRIQNVAIFGGSTLSRTQSSTAQVAGLVV